MNTQPQPDDFTGTYSPEDDKLRLYAAYRLDKELYEEARAAGFRWAPKQELFYSFWSPKAEDFLLSLAGSIGDEDTSLADRAEERADRFGDYQVKRASEANSLHESVSELADSIPFGQPILVGHHSEKHARRDAEKIENGMRKVINLFETSEYWKYRAAGALRHAKYKERPEVRARRIKKLEAETRKYKASYTPNPKVKPLMQQDWRDSADSEPVLHVFCGNGRGGNWVKESSLPGIEKYYARLIAHNDNRLIYERAMLGEQGGLDLLKPKPRPKQPPLLNYRAPEGLSIENRYHRGEFSTYRQQDTTKAEYSKIHADYKGTRHINGHRVRIAIIPCAGAGYNREWVCIFLTDSKVHAQPETE
jgi:hypothetical protein